MDKKALQAELEQYVNPEYRAFLLDQIPMGEKLLEQVTPNSPHWGDVIRPLTLMYLEMNRQLGIVCKHLNYPMRQWEWDEGVPLTVLAETFRGIGATEWYQRHLSMMLMPPAREHPWTKIIDWPKKGETVCEE